jgi:hypothetical protein
MQDTQGRRLIAMLKRRGMTTMDMLLTAVSVSPWKRIGESLRPGEQLLKRKNNQGRTVYRVIGK